MTRPKKKRTDLTAPKYVTDRWNSGTTARDEMADLLIHLNGDKDSRSLSLSLSTNINNMSTTALCSRNI